VDELQFELNDLKKRLLYLLNISKENVIIKPITNCDIISSDNELEALLKTGKGNIQIKGKYTSNGETINIQSWSPNRTFDYIISKFEKELIQGDISFTDLSNENGTNIELKVLKTRNKDLIIRNTIAKLDKFLVGSINFDTIVVENNKVVRKSIDELLLNTYRMYSELCNTMLLCEKNKLENLKEEYDLLEKLKPYISKYCTSSNKPSKITEIISEESKIEIDKIQNILSKYRINKLFSVRTDTKDLVSQIEKIDLNLKNINEYVINEYQLI
jgi:hypothetical protein